LRTAAAINGHLQAALRGRERWVLVADCQDGHTALSSLALALAHVGGVSRTYPVLGYGLVNFANQPTGHSGALSFLTVPKALLSAADLSGYLAAVRPGCPGTDGTRDVILLGGTRDHVLIQAFLTAAEAGGLADAAEAN
jgi:hypothetical protein